MNKDTFIFNRSKGYRQIGGVTQNKVLFPQHLEVTGAQMRADTVPMHLLFIAHYSFRKAKL